MSILQPDPHATSAGLPMPIRWLCCSKFYYKRPRGPHYKEMNALKCRTVRAMSSCDALSSRATRKRNRPCLFRLDYYYIMRMRAFRRKWPTVRMAFNGGVLDLCNGAVSEETPQFFLRVHNVWALWL